MLTFCGVQGFAQTPSWGDVRVAEHPVSVRHRPDAASPLVRTLRPGDTVRAVPVTGGWAELYDMTEAKRDVTKAIGYAPLAQLTPQAQAHVPAPPVKRAPAQRPAQTVSGSSEVKGEVQPGGGKPLLSGSAPSSTPQDPVRITSDRMVYSQSENAVIFLGNVHGTQKDMAIWSAKITAYFSEKAKDGKSAGGGKPAAQKSAPKSAQPAGPSGSGDFGDKIERIVAEGNVRLVAGKNEGACAKLIYFVPEGVLRMEGNPILREGKSTVRGDIIKFYIHENRSEVLSSQKKRVEAIFYQEKGEGK